MHGAACMHFYIKSAVIHGSLVDKLFNEYLVS